MTCVGALGDNIWQPEPLPLSWFSPPRLRYACLSNLVLTRYFAFVDTTMHGRLEARTLRVLSDVSTSTLFVRSP